MKRHFTWRTGFMLLFIVMLALAVNIPLAQQQMSCPGAPASRLIVGEQGRVGPNGANNMRSAAATDGQLIGQIPAGGAFVVLEGPVCANNLAWWRVDFAGTIGWTAEGQGADYWLEPAGPLPAQAATVTVYPTTTDTAPQTACPGFLPSRLIVGEQARIVPGPANNLRADPTAGSERLAEIPGGRTILVLEGPVCAGGLAWWRVDFNGIIGWTPEGADDTYWVEPAGPVPTQAPTLTPTITPTPRPTNTPAPTYTPAPAMPLISTFDGWDALTRATLSTNRAAISSENITALQPLAILGTGGISQFELSPDGKYFAIINNLGVWLNHLETPSPAGTLLETANLTVRDIAFSPNGRYLAVGCSGLPGSTGNKLFIWDLEAGELLDISLTNNISAVAFSADSRALAVGVDTSNPLRVIRLSSGSITGPDVQLGEVSQIAFSPDGTLLAAVSSPQIEVFNLATNRHQLIYEVQADIQRVTFSPDSGSLITLGTEDFSESDMMLRVWNLVNSERLPAPERFGNLAPLSRRLLTTAAGEIVFSVDDTIYFWNPGSGLVSHSVQLETTISGFGLLPDGNLVLAHFSGEIIHHELATGANTVLLNRPDHPGELKAISPTGSLLAFAPQIGQIDIFDTMRGEAVQSLETGRTSAVAFSADETELLAASQTGVTVWNLESGESAATDEPFPVLPVENEDELKALAASLYPRGYTWQIRGVWTVPDTNLLAVEREGILTFWDRLVRLPLFSTPMLGRVQGFSADGTLLVTHLEHGIYILWGISQS